MTDSARLSYEQVVRERDRLRDARGAITRQLGPLPVAAGISTALVGAVADKPGKPVFLYLALCTLAVLVLVSFLYSGMRPYRQLRALHEEEWRLGLEQRHPGILGKAERNDLPPEVFLGEGDWYAEMLRLERKIYGESRAGNAPFRPPWPGVEDLQDGLDR